MVDQSVTSDGSVDDNLPQGETSHHSRRIRHPKLYTCHHPPGWRWVHGLPGSRESKLQIGSAFHCGQRAGINSLSSLVARFNLHQIIIPLVPRVWRCRYRDFYGQNSKEAYDCQTTSQTFSPPIAHSSAIPPQSQKSRARGQISRVSPTHHEPMTNRIYLLDRLRRAGTETSGRSELLLPGFLDWNRRAIPTQRP